MLSTKVSIITVVYNAVATIEQTILSVVKQDYSNIEYIIVDGGSTDGTLDIVKKYEKKIALWLSEPDHGIYDAMNKGLTHATGDYIYYLGADDCLLDRFDTSYHIAADYKNFLKFYLDQNIALKKSAMIVAYYANDGVSGNGSDAQRMEDVRALQENGVNVTAYYAKKKQEKSSHMTNILRWVFDKTGILRQIRLRRGWKKHRCGWEVCRWCNR